MKSCVRLLRFFLLFIPFASEWFAMCLKPTESLHIILISISLLCQQSVFVQPNGRREFFFLAAFLRSESGIWFCCHIVSFSFFFFFCLIISDITYYEFIYYRCGALYLWCIVFRIFFFHFISLWQSFDTGAGGGWEFLLLFVSIFVFHLFRLSTTERCNIALDLFTYHFD